MHYAVHAEHQRERDSGNHAKKGMSIVPVVVEENEASITDSPNIGLQVVRGIRHPVSGLTLSASFSGDTPCGQMSVPVMPVFLVLELFPDPRFLVMTRKLTLALSSSGQRNVHHVSTLLLASDTPSLV